MSSEAMYSENDEEVGFTLLEAIIALAIMVLAFSSILRIQNNSLEMTRRASRSTEVAMLLKRAMIQAELEFEGKNFEAVKDEDSGDFEAPFQEYKWSWTIKEVEFPDLVSSFLGGGEGEDGNAQDNQQANTEQLDNVAKLVTQYLSDSLREVEVVVSWQGEGEEEQSYSIATYWVNLTQQFRLTQ